jgi:DNA polymerase-3 subunit gamma/tau
MPSVLTDQAIAFGDGALREAEVASMLGTVDRSARFYLLDALLDDDPAGGAGELCGRWRSRAWILLAAVDELCSVLHRCAIAQAVPGRWTGSSAMRSGSIALAARMSAEDVQLFHELAQRRAIADCRRDRNPRAAFEMLALRLARFPAGGGPRSGLTADDLVTAPEPAAREVSDPVKKPEPPPAAPRTQTTQSWYEVLDGLALTGSVLEHRLAACSNSTRVGGPHSWALTLDETRANLFNERHVGVIERRAVGAAWPAGRQLTLTIGRVAGETPAQRRRRLEAERLQRAETEIAEDPRVRQLLDGFWWRGAKRLGNGREALSAVVGEGRFNRAVAG